MSLRIRRATTDLRRAVLQIEQMPLAFAESVFGRHRPAECDCLTGEIAEEIAGVGRIGGVGEYVDVNVSVADVAEDHVAAGNSRSKLAR